MVPEYERFSVHYENGVTSLRALKDFHQGEVIWDSNTYDNPDRLYSHPVDVIQASDDPNASLRNKRIVAFRCIKAGEDITMKGRNQ